MRRDWRPEGDVRAMRWGGPGLQGPGGEPASGSVGALSAGVPV
ncbi:hypothetical protein ACFVHR_04505 [Streptomyces sp. NPDC127168]